MTFAGALPRGPHPGDGVDWKFGATVTANSLQHWPSPSKRRPVSHRSATVGQVCRNGLTTCYRFFNFWPWGEGHQNGRWPTIRLDLSFYKTSARSRKRSMRYHFLAPGRLTPGPKFTNRGEDLADYEFYQPAKFHRSTPIHAWDIRYKIPADKETNKQTKKQTNSNRYIHNMPIGMCG